MRNHQLNTTAYVRIYAQAVARDTGNGTEWETIRRRLDRLQLVAVGLSAYVRDCIAHARQTAHTEQDTAATRGEVYADMQLVELHLLGW
jgi:hypothetical protein